MVHDFPSAYDELIENSRRRIRLLEGMARALYREWFVHFRFPGNEKLPRVTSPIGDIPKGWEGRFGGLAIGTSTSHQRVKPENLLAMPSSRLQPQDSRFHRPPCHRAVRRTGPGDVELFSQVPPDAREFVGIRPAATRQLAG